MPAHGLTLRVVSKESAAEGVVVLVLEHANRARLRDWTPGAHIDLVLPDGTVRPYSLCGDRWDPYQYRIAVLREPDGRGGSAYVHDRLRVGDVVGVGGPRNNFPMVPSEHYLFLAGGIGITPLLPMIHQADLIGADWRLVYGGRRRASMAFLDELARHGDRVDVVPEDERGRPDLGRRLGEPREGLRVYCCGPAGMIRAAERVCGPWPAPTLRTERFTARTPRAAAQDTPFELVLARTGRRVTVTPSQTVVDALRSVGVDRLTSCESGTCGTCEAAVVSGEVDHRDSLFSEEERQAGDRMLPCVSRSFGDRLVLDI
ncbi:ferredoxin [Nocardiopsis sp. CNR-923]|uniref:PDR/VanB family oxidoreductase n=1 Tax=Nocardiopsis sp. CNR-923 TaxID=1904965 RepID=UPI0009653A4A|nr:PDR/VanB family oxidoreductase [Nocardiopsis sp. CNR-923]OLT27595.1 ferredoxin [Nocardiopsis sp. CNR-923]